MELIFFATVQIEKESKKAEYRLTEKSEPKILHLYFFSFFFFCHFSLQVHRVALYINSPEGAYRADILAATTTNTKFMVDGWYIKIAFVRLHAYCLCGTVFGACTAVIAISNYYAIFLYKMYQTYL